VTDKEDGPELSSLRTEIHIMNPEMLFAEFSAAGRSVQVRPAGTPPVAEYPS
jgi:hypothetical protein